MKFDHTVDWFYKYPDEKFSFEYDFTNDLSSGEALSSCAASVFNSYGVDNTSTIIDSTAVSSPDAIITVQAGTPDTTYQIKIAGTSDALNVYVHYVQMEVFGSLILVSNLGDSTANSYITLEEANKYVRNKYGHGNTWDNLSTEGKKRVLVQATRELDRYNFIDEKYYDGQPLQFPRDTHTVITGNCATFQGEATATLIDSQSFQSDSLYSETYGLYPTNHWKYGSCHITDFIDEVELIATSNADTGVIHLQNSLTASLTTSSNFIVFEPLMQDIKDAVAEQAMYVSENYSTDSLQAYRTSGAKEVKIGDVRVTFLEGSGSDSKTVISNDAKKLLSRWIKKSLVVNRA